MNINNSLPELILNTETQLVSVDDDTPTISVLWDRAVQTAVISSSPGPTVASRAYGILHTAMFDAWAAYDEKAIATQLGDDLQQPSSENTDENKTEAMSYAAYRVLTELFPGETALFDAVMEELAFDPANASVDTSTPAGVGNVTAEALMVFRRGDGANQLGDDPDGISNVPYSNNTSNGIGYSPENPVNETVNIEKWTPELVPIGEGPDEQMFLTPQWGDVTPFALAAGDEFRPDAPQPFLVEGVEGVVDLNAKTISLADGTVLEISKDLIGDVINPEFIAQAERVIDLSANITDEEKLIAEFWEDAGGTSFPPGTWMTFGQFVSARDDHSLDEDVKLFFGLGNAVFDAGVATWEAKTFYDYARPVRAIRNLGELGLVGEFDNNLGGYAIDAWAGPAEGTQRILATDFLTYQTPGGDPSPPFSEYTSGHSAFSASGGEILKLFTGSDSFGASVYFAPGESRFEEGVTPVEGVTLSWDTFTEAADEGGSSRLYGGIHFDEGDLNGRTLGRQVGGAVLNKTLAFINGGEAVNSIIGTEARDRLTGTKADDRIVALGDKDILKGRNGDDTLLGGDGKDDLFGAQGKDVLLGGQHHDRLFGGKDDDSLYGDEGRDTLAGNAGNDLLVGGEGTDFLSGGRGQDAFSIGAKGGRDFILDFDIRDDFIILEEGITAQDLNIFQRGRNTVIGNAETGDKIAVLRSFSFLEGLEGRRDSTPLFSARLITVSEFAAMIES